ncbi:hypothetical protein [Neoroseomonas lacus]|uniref:Uncharacterized protein n=1 Tax=Neoroseomonas lacus TaxID=287609 RepID=A0A917NV36_9PROT|nr:hypothetical protein [Neoroseomonas lacus]GGJ30975.1 hypothetical protein GCM10011320_42960 [Neoroseomonas lacus]
MSHVIALGQIKVRSPDDKSMLVHQKGAAFIWTGADWHPLKEKARVAVDHLTKQITVRINRSDLTGLPTPTASVLVEDPIAGWNGVAIVFEHG